MKPQVVRLKNLQLTFNQKELLKLISEELDKARAEGRDEGINAVLYPKLKRDKNGTLKREGWVDTSKLMRRTKMEKVEHGVPSGGFNKEFCLNSQLFKKRICKQDGKEYQAGERCSCFT